MIDFRRILESEFQNRASREKSIQQQYNDIANALKTAVTNCKKNKSTCNNEDDNADQPHKVWKGKVVQVDNSSVKLN